MTRITVRNTALAIVFASALAGAATAQQSPAPAADAPKIACGGDLSTFLAGVKVDGRRGRNGESVDKTFAGAQLDQKVLARDRARRLQADIPRIFAAHAVSQGRLDIGRQKMKQYADVSPRPSRIRRSGRVIAAFSGDGDRLRRGQGDFNTRNALVTLSHDCRRPEVFRPQLIALVEWYSGEMSIQQRQLAPGLANRPDADAAKSHHRLRRGWRRHLTPCRGLRERA